jgi:hypothetical protein
MAGAKPTPGRPPPGRALEGGMRAVLDLDPFAAAAGAIAAIASLGDDPLKPHHTRLSENDRAVRILDMAQ